MEPLRGFQNLYVLYLMHSNNQRFTYSHRRSRSLRLQLAGSTHSGSWKEHLMDAIGDRVPSERIHFTGLLNYQDYRSLLWRSNLHCYFTRPYVTSWSLFEAASCGARLLTNHGEATSNIAKPTTITMIDLDDQQAVNDAIIEELTKSQKGLHPRAEIMEGYSLSKNLKQWEILINDQIKNQSSQSKG